MKNNLISILIIIMAAIGCTREKDSFNKGPFVPDSDFRAVMNGFDTETKVSFGEDTIIKNTTYIKIIWQENDSISVFQKNTAKNSLYKLNSEENSTYGVFTHVNSDTPIEVAVTRNLAVYPYSTDYAVSKNHRKFTISNIEIPHIQNYVKKNFDPKAFTIVAVSKNNFLSFKNVCGILRLQFVDTTGNGTIKSITITGNNGEFLAGNSTVILDKKGNSTISFPTENKFRDIILDCGTNGVKLSSDEQKPTVFNIVLPPVKLKNGFTVIIRDKDGLMKTLVTKTEKPITRNNILTMASRSIQ